MATQRKAPKLRFKGFTDNWQQQKISDLLRVPISNGVMNHPGKNDLGIKDINVINLYQGDFIDTNLLNYINIDNKTFQKNRANKGDIFVTRSSLKAEGIAQINVLLESGRYVFDDHVMKITLNKNLDPYFIKYLLTSFNVHKQFVAKAKTGTMTTIGQKDISSSKVILPKLNEQIKISNLTFKLNRIIALQQHKLAQMQELKKGFLQNLFSIEDSLVPKLRFKGFVDNWKQFKLKDVLEKLKDGTHSSFQSTKDGPFLLSAKNIRNDQLILTQNERHISREDLDRINKTFSPVVGDILLTIVGTIGNTYLVNKPLHDMAFQRSVAFLRPKKDILSLYLKDLLDTEPFESQIKRRETLSAQPGIYLNDLSQIELVLSSDLKEQKNISTLLSKIDKIIFSQQRKISKLKQFKNFLLQNMFI